MDTHLRKKRKTLMGTVTSRSGNKTIKVTYAYRASHPRYVKEINRRTVVHVHDEQNQCSIGDRVEIMETRPLSKLKCWRIVRRIESEPESSQ
jgi:small subunit ribosomal protein S17